MQKPSIGHIPGAIAAKAPQTGGALGDERRQKLGPLFCSRSSPNDPRSVTLCTVSSRQSPDLDSLGQKKMCARLRSATASTRPDAPAGLKAGELLSSPMRFCYGRDRPKLLAATPAPRAAA
jgi:hypothetical protein